MNNLNMREKIPREPLSKLKLKTGNIDIWLESRKLTQVKYSEGSAAKKDYNSQWLQHLRSAAVWEL